MYDKLTSLDYSPYDLDLSAKARDISELTRPVEPDKASGERTPNRRPVVQLLVCPGPRFVGARAARFVRSATPLCRAKPFVVLDMSEVTRMDAAGLLAIISLVRVCRGAGGALRLCSPNQAVRRLLAAAGVHHLVDVYHTRRHAAFV
jgi:anti-anti-sigma factor